MAFNTVVGGIQDKYIQEMKENQTKLKNEKKMVEDELRELKSQKMSNQKSFSSMGSKSYSACDLSVGSSGESPKTLEKVVLNLNVQLLEKDDIIKDLRQQLQAFNQVQGQTQNNTQSRNSGKLPSAHVDSRTMKRSATNETVDDEVSGAKQSKRTNGRRKSSSLNQQKTMKKT